MASKTRSRLLFWLPVLTAASLSYFARYQLADQTTWIRSVVGVAVLLLAYEGVRFFLERRLPQENVEASIQP